MGGRPGRWVRLLTGKSFSRYPPRKVSLSSTVYLGASSRSTLPPERTTVQPLSLASDGLNDLRNGDGLLQGEGGRRGGRGCCARPAPGCCLKPQPLHVSGSPARCSTALAQLTRLCAPTTRSDWIRTLELYTAGGFTMKVWAAFGEQLHLAGHIADNLQRI